MYAYTYKSEEEMVSEAPGELPSYDKCARLNQNGYPPLLLEE